MRVSLDDYGQTRTSSGNTIKISLGPIEVWFSYATAVAFRVPGLPTVVHENAWSNTTGKHLNWIDGETSKTAKNRVNREKFEELWEIHVAKYFKEPEPPKEKEKIEIVAPVFEGIFTNLTGLFNGKPKDGI